MDTLSIIFEEIFLREKYFSILSYLAAQLWIKCKGKQWDIQHSKTQNIFPENTLFQEAQWGHISAKL